MRVMARYRDDKGKDKAYLVEEKGKFRVVDARAIKLMNLENAVILRSGKLRATAGNYIETLNANEFEGILSNKEECTSKVKSKVNYNAEVELQLTHMLKITLSENDVFNWITSCDNVETLRYLGRYALKCAHSLENPDTENDIYS